MRWILLAVGVVLLGGASFVGYFIYQFVTDMRRLQQMDLPPKVFSVALPE